MTSGPKPREARLGPTSLELRFLIGDVVARDGIEFLDLHLFRHELLVLRGRVEVSRARRRFQFDLFTHVRLPLIACCQTCSPRERNSAKTASMPFLSMVRNPALVKRRLI